MQHINDITKLKNDVFLHCCSKTQDVLIGTKQRSHRSRLLPGTKQLDWNQARTEGLLKLNCKKAYEGPRE